MHRVRSLCALEQGREQVGVSHPGHVYFVGFALHTGQIFDAEELATEAMVGGRRFLNFFLSRVEARESAHRPGLPALDFHHHSSLNYVLHLWAKNAEYVQGSFILG